MQGDEMMSSEVEEKKPLVIGVAGGTASGKTTVVRKIEQRIRYGVSVIFQDAYYKDLSHLPLEERKKVNFDHPSAFDTKLLIEHLKKLISWQPIDMPVYSYSLYTRLPETIRVNPNKVIIVEGILVLAEKALRELLDIKVYVDAPDDIRFIRRLQRDIKERGRTIDSVIQQYLTYVRPMHLEFIEPSKKWADIIIPTEFSSDVALDVLIAKIMTHLSTPQPNLRPSLTTG